MSMNGEDGRSELIKYEGGGVKQQENTRKQEVKQINKKKRKQRQKSVIKNKPPRYCL